MRHQISSSPLSLLRLPSHLLPLPQTGLSLSLSTCKNVYGELVPLTTRVEDHPPVGEGAGPIHHQTSVWRKCIDGSTWSTSLAGCIG